MQINGAIICPVKIGMFTSRGSQKVDLSSNLRLITELNQVQTNTKNLIGLKNRSCQNVALRP
jgi:hypothetical protein